MALQGIGVGFGRTGTLSLKLALELMHHPDYVVPWQAAVEGAAVDWDQTPSALPERCLSSMRIHPPYF
jgi:hypothetical protein